MTSTTKHIQEAVAGFVAERGYRKGYTAAGFLARQIVKAIEELAEIGGEVQLPGRLQAALQNAGEWARRTFDSAWAANIPKVRARKIAEELADLQVVLFCAAETLSEILGEDFDLAQAALEKAKADVKRGMR